MVRLFGGDPGGTRNGPAVPSPRGNWWSPPDCLSTSSAALGRCVSRRATTTTGQHRLLTAPGLRMPTGGTVPRVRPLAGPCLAFVNQDWRVQSAVGHADSRDVQIRHRREREGPALFDTLGTFCPEQTCSWIRGRIGGALDTRGCYLGPRGPF